MLRKIIYICYLIFIFFNVYHLYKIYKPSPAVLSKKILPPVAKPVEVFGRVGGYQIEELTGWTSPFAEVTLTSQGLARKTTADEKGFFAFYFIPVPENLGELCLISQDVNQLPSYPTCLAPPARNRFLKINNVLLAPTIFLDKDKIPSGGTTKASGMTFPDSEVDVHLYTENNLSIFARINSVGARFPHLLRVFNKNLIGLGNPTPTFWIIKSVYAMGLPEYRIKSNANGYFEFSLPANVPSENRIFVSSVFSSPSQPDPQLTTHPHPQYNSPKSFTLFFQTLGLWGLIKLFLANFLQQAKIFFAGLKNDPLNIVLIEIVVLLALVVAIVAKKTSGEKTSGENPRQSARNPR